MARHRIEESLHEPDEEGQLDRRVHEDEPQVRVPQAQLARQAVDRDHRRRERHGLEKQDGVRDPALAPELDPRERVTGERHAEDREQHGRDRHEDAVAEGRRERVPAEDLDEVVDRELGRPADVGLGVGVESRGEEPDEGREEKHRDEHKGDVHQEPLEPGAAFERAHARWDGELRLRLRADDAQARARDQRRYTIANAALSASITTAIVEP